MSDERESQIVCPEDAFPYSEDFSVQRRPIDLTTSIASFWLNFTPRWRTDDRYSYIAVDGSDIFGVVWMERVREDRLVVLGCVVRPDDNARRRQITQMTIVNRCAEVQAAASPGVTHVGWFLPSVHRYEIGLIRQFPNFGWRESRIGYGSLERRITLWTHQVGPDDGFGSSEPGTDSRSRDGEAA